MPRITSNIARFSPDIAVGFISASYALMKGIDDFTIWFDTREEAVHQRHQMYAFRASLVKHIADRKKRLEAASKTPLALMTAGLAETEEIKRLSGQLESIAPLSMTIRLDADTRKWGITFYTAAFKKISAIETAVSSLIDQFPEAADDPIMRDIVLLEKAKQPIIDDDGEVW